MLFKFQFRDLSGSVEIDPSGRARAYAAILGRPNAKWVVPNLTQPEIDAVMNAARQGWDTFCDWVFTHPHKKIDTRAL